MNTRVVLVLVLIALAIASVSGVNFFTDSGTRTASTRGVKFEVPSGWNLQVLSNAKPCPPVATKLVVVAENGLGGDCPPARSTDLSISATQMSPLEVAPPTLSKLGDLEGWQRGTADNWVVVVPKSNLQITFRGAIGDEVRKSVIDSITAA